MARLERIEDSCPRAPPAIRAPDSWLTAIDLPLTVITLSVPTGWNALVRFSSPSPYVPSTPLVPRSVAVCSSTAAAVPLRARTGQADSRSAIDPATIGAAIEVPDQ